MFILASPRSEFRLEENGSVFIKDNLNMEPNSLICAFGGYIYIGNACVNRNCLIVSRKQIYVGNGITIGSNVCIYDHNHNFKNDSLEDHYISDSIYIEDDVWIGANAVILKGVHIAKGAVIAAGAVAVSDVPAETLAKGVPAKIAKKDG